MKIRAAILIFLCHVLFSGALTAAAQTAETSSDNHKDHALKEVTAIHGGTGPFAIAGYRMEARAMQ